jgi:hypothetical protein
MTRMVPPAFKRFGAFQIQRKSSKGLPAWQVTCYDKYDNPRGGGQHAESETTRW